MTGKAFSLQHGSCGNVVNEKSVCVEASGNFCLVIVIYYICVYVCFIMVKRLTTVVFVNSHAVLQTNLIKESIRMGYNDFGDFFYAHGALGDAFKHYVRTRDYCTTSKHIIHMCMSAILVSIEMGQFTHVTSYVSKAEQSEGLDPITGAKLRCAAGLAHLEAKKYKLAARKVCYLL